LRSNLATFPLLSRLFAFDLYPLEDSGFCSLVTCCSWPFFFFFFWGGVFPSFRDAGHRYCASVPPPCHGGKARPSRSLFFFSPRVQRLSPSGSPHFISYHPFKPGVSACLAGPTSPFLHGSRDCPPPPPLIVGS